MNRWLICCTLALAACGSTQDDGLATATFDIQQAPSDAVCVQVTVTGATRAVTKGFTLTQGQSTASLTASGLPIGAVVISGNAYNVLCGQVNGSTQATWLVNPVAATFTAAGPNNASLVLTRNGQATLGFDFQDDQRTVTTLVAGMNGPAGIVADGSGNLYVADGNNNQIRKITGGSMTTFAGQATAGELDGTGTAAKFNFPTGLAIDSGATTLYVTDGGGCTVRKIVISTAAVSTIAGQPCNSQSADGTGAAARFVSPFGLALDGSGVLYVADRAAIRQIVLSTNAVTTVAGNVTQTTGYADGAASAARFNNALGLAWDGGALYIVDGAPNNLVRKFTPAPTSTVSTVAGSTAGAEIDGVGTGAAFNVPYGIAADGKGNLLVVDQGGETVRKVVESSGVVVTVAGSAGNFGTTDGVGSAARFNAPLMVAIDSAGVAYITDNVSDVRKMQ